MRVLQLLWDGHTGGTQRYVDGLLRADWGEVSHAVCLFAGEGDTIHAGCPYPVSALGLGSGFAWWKAAGLRRVVEEFDPQVLHVHCDTPAFLHQARRFGGRRIVYTEHGDSVVRARREWLTSLCWRYAGRAIDQVLVNSAFAGRVFAAGRPGLADRCEVLPNPLPGGIPARPARRPGVFRVGAVGRLERVKGMDRLVAAAALLAEEDLAFHVYGDGSQRAELESAAGERFTFHGMTDAPLAAMAELDLLVVPSRQEAFGLVVIEAQAVGTPVLAVSVGGLPELIEDGVSGMLCDGTAAGIAAGIRRVLADPAGAQARAAAACGRVREAYSLAAHVSRLKVAYGFA